MKKMKAVLSGYDNKAMEAGIADVVVARRKSLEPDQHQDRGHYTNSSSDTPHHALPNNPVGLSLEDNPDLKHLCMATRRMSTTLTGSAWKPPTRSVDPSANPSPQLRRRLASRDQNEPEADDFNIADFEEYEDEIVQYINIKSQTATQGHAGASLYLKFGCISKLQLQSSHTFRLILLNCLINVNQHLLKYD